MTASTNDRSMVEALETLLWSRRSVRAYSELPIGLRSMQRILAAAQGITSDDGKRTAPSAHALCPLELFVVIRRVRGLDPGFYKYSPEDCNLCAIGQAPMDGELLSTALGDDKWLEDAAAVVVVAARLDEAIRHFAEQQPDGMRGARYVQFEAGACTQNMYLAVTAENLGSVVVMGFDDHYLKDLLPLPEGTDPIALFCIGPPKVG
ncbi:SagB/ThcOx family dehydrogenase [Paraburkholderia fungorum]|uniref:SagB/ThcOx family dehydrogenase n=1 Tax=Paraburkholderia fungorum TaxID=134537 RepID=UPI00402B27CD